LHDIDLGSFSFFMRVQLPIFILLVPLTLAAWNIFPPNEANAPTSTWIVTKIIDTDDGVCNADCSLREAVAATNADVNPSLITFDPIVFSSSQTITLLLGQLAVNNGRQVTIAGPSADLLTISGNNSSRIFRFKSEANVNLSGVRLTNGNGVGEGFGNNEGGAIYVEGNGQGTQLTITNSVFTGNHADVGGALRINGLSNVSISDSNISGNSAIGNPGGGGVYAYGSNLTLQGCTVSNNIANYQSGFYGAVGAAGSGSLTISDSVIDGNSSTNTGGIGIGVSATIANTTVSNNSNTGINVGAVTTISGSTISGNTGGGIFASRFLSITDSLITGNSATNGGGVSGGENFVISNSTLSNNTATNSGGAIYNNLFSDPGVPLGPATITNCVVFGNSAGSFGGAILNRSRFEMLNSTVRDNSAGAGGGAAYNVKFTGSQAANLTVTNSTIFGNRSDASGGAFQNQAGVINVTNSTISSNVAPIGAGTAALMTQGGILNLSFSTVAFNSGTGAAVRVNSGAGTVNSSNTIIASNISVNPGPDFTGQLTSQGFNLIGNTTNATISGTTTGNILNADPMLAPDLMNNGGPTLTHSLQPSSLAIDAGNSAGTFLNDQRGLPRPYDFLTVPNSADGDGADIGAFECQLSDFPTPTATNTPTPTPTADPVITGTITYGNAIGSPSPRFVSNVLLNGAGSVPVSAFSSFPDGTYSLSGFGSGSYTVTPTKTGGVHGISSFDSAKIAQHVAGVSALTGNQLIVADVSGNGAISSFDAGQVARYAAGVSGFGSTGNWIFTPANRNYASVTGSITGEDFIALLMGEVSGNWTNTGARPVSGER